MSERLDGFMARANVEYYATHDPFADFTTSPEIIQVFGEILGLWTAVTWETLGRPDPVLLVEAGPGRGTLMADALRAVVQAAPGFRAALSLHLIETSPRLRAIQGQRLPDATWHEDLTTIPQAPMLLLANEFLDALPIRQFIRRGDSWMERYVGPEGFVERQCPAPAGDAPNDGTVVEICEAGRTFVAGVADRIDENDGAALFLDYGSEHCGPDGSLQAIAGGKFADPLSPPGTADLTALVDFAALAGVARRAGMAVHGPVPQGQFLARLGLFQRTNMLARRQPPRRAAALIDAAQRLAEPHRMGRLFKAMALSRPGLPPLPGFCD